VNLNSVKPEAFASYKDLLKPQWKGKIVAQDPRGSGPGQATFLFFYLHTDLGPDFIRALAGQGIMFLRDYQQEVDGLGHGNYSLLLGGPEPNTEQPIEQGLPIAIVDPSKLKEYSDIGAGNVNVALFNKAPHPNAARVYLNWLLSKEGQTLFARAQVYVSNRLDVPTDFLEQWRVPQPGAIVDDSLEAQQIRGEKLLPLLTEVLGK